MKRLQGYLIDRETGAGISGKTVSFENLAGAAITTATTYAQAVDTVTDSDGKFESWFELSPGPVNVQVDVSGTEVKVRKHDEMAQFGAVWSSDIQRMGRAFPNGIIDGYLNEMAVTTPSGHNIVIATGSAIIDGHVFSIENGAMTIAGAANNNAGIANRLDLVTLRQYKEAASGQDSGRQTVVVTQGVTTGVAPATPTGSDFTDIPLAVVSTAYLAPTKSVHKDLRYRSSGNPAISVREETSATTVITGTYATMATVEAEGLIEGVVYDGLLTLMVSVEYRANASAAQPNNLWVRMDFDFFAEGVVSDTDMGRVYSISTATSETDWLSLYRVFPIQGLTGVSDVSIDVELRKFISGNGTLTTGDIEAVLSLVPRR